jgi:FkbM family methyltransferase
MKKLVENLAASAWRRLTTALHNKQIYSFSREEIRQVAFSFSQFGEDLAVSRLARDLGIKEGCYVDVGAFHPVHLSNTILLYQSGWRGVNIDLRPQAIALFNQYRPADFNVCAAISDKTERVAVEINGRPTDRILPAVSVQTPESTVQFVETRSLQSVLDQCPFPLPSIDYLNVDCEGHDIAVLRSLNWVRHEPKIITVEALDDASVSAMREEMRLLSYQLVGKLSWTLVFIREEVLRASSIGETVLPDCRSTRVGSCVRTQTD